MNSIATVGQRGGGARRPSIRKLVAALAVGVGVLAVVMAVALIWTSVRMKTTVDTAARETQSQALANELELSLLTYQRVSNLQVLTGEAQLAVAKRELAADIARQLSQIPAYAATAKERRLVATASASVRNYLRQRQQLEARQQVGFREIVRLTRPVFNQALTDLDTLRDQNAAKAAQASADAAMGSRIASSVAITTAVLMLLALLSVIWAMTRYLLRPLLSLRAAIKKLEAGETPEPIEDSGLREVAEVTRGFNDMAAALARRRAGQLSFLAGVAHDLRNPLSAMKLALESLDKDQSETQRSRTQHLLERQLDRLSRMVDDLLDATRIEAGHLELRVEEFDVRDVVTDMISLYAPTSPDHQIVANIAPTPVRVYGDPLRIEQVVSNLLSNAVKFSPAGGRITVELGADERHAVLSVSDQGVGMRPEELADIFRPFRRYRPEVAPGAGLGLSVVRRIVEAHGGTIEVESAPGNGSSFHIRLPRPRKDQALSDRADEQPPHAPAR